MKDTEQDIIDSAILIFNEDLSAPLEKVAEQAQTTRRTLHRYFKDRKELMDSCQKEVRKTCHAAMLKAYNSSDDPMEKLERMFYAGVDCGTKHSFLHKLHTMHDHSHQAGNEECSGYDNTFHVWKSHLQYLLETGKINPVLTLDWIHHLHHGIVAASIATQTARKMPDAELKKLAWVSFSRAISI
ncbi:TetR/AcrR family transcriptional regulator [Dyadobacter luticola]|uniref:TetR/AcrR family transcriptional regulator n=1 Tax=Dyadobacter luticola TaxID=1979387 RepID=A0A5R9L2F3_9BACT|nr:TetR family transcriptional regulator [Dyadobacter luticola]TLV02762.1 TetR/AcrR family transcriptional regulator [Dyadobacter luticola]